MNVNRLRRRTLGAAASLDLPARTYELSSGLTVALGQTDAEARWLAGEDVLAGALVGKDGRVLIAQRPPGKAHAGKWEFPGGKKHPAERPQQGLHRELQEELGIEVAEDAVCETPVSGVDIPETIFGFAGIRPPWATHGHDLTPLLKNPKAAWIPRSNDRTCLSGHAAASAPSSIAARS